MSKKDLCVLVYMVSNVHVIEHICNSTCIVLTAFLLRTRCTLQGFLGCMLYTYQEYQEHIACLGRAYYAHSVHAVLAFGAHSVRISGVLCPL